MSQYPKRCCPTVSKNVGNYTNYTDYINSQRACNVPVTECKRGPQGPQGPTGAPGSATNTGATGPTGPVASGSNIAATYYSLITQGISNSTPTLFSFEIVGLELGISKNAGNTQIIIQTAGVYEIWYSIQLHSIVSQDVFTYIWLVKNGIELADTNGRIETKSNTSDSLPIVPYILNLNVGDTISFASQTNASSSGDIQALYVSGATIPGPNVPSIIVGVKKIATDVGSSGLITSSIKSITSSSLTTFTTAKLDLNTLPLHCLENKNYKSINIPNATIIYINNNTSDTRYITNINGGVDGRMVIFTLFMDSHNNGTIIFTNQHAVNGTGIFIGEMNNCCKNIKLTAGKSICFIYMANARIPNNSGFNVGQGSGLWMLQYCN